MKAIFRLFQDRNAKVEANYEGYKPVEVITLPSDGGQILFPVCTGGVNTIHCAALFDHKGVLLMEFKEPFVITSVTAGLIPALTVHID